MKSDGPGKAVYRSSSVTYALKSRDLLFSRGIQGVCGAAAAHAGKRCGYGLYVPQHADAAERILREAGVRVLFRTEQGIVMIYLDNSATTYQKPQAVRRRMAEALERFGANPGRGGFRMSMETAEAVYAVRRGGRVFGAEGPECVSFQPSCTQALNIVIHSLKPGDHVLVTDLEHNAVLRPLKGDGGAGRFFHGRAGHAV